MVFTNWFEEFVKYKNIPNRIFESGNGTVIDTYELIQLINNSSNKEQIIIKEIIEIVEKYHGDINAVFGDIAKLIK
ncbi:hypothetical protein [Schinkia azotoformans]|uniref:hypothetical protein n=1 Tax=Schinkia azotoformans TaxID=1454 RepID=UPI002DBD76A1|nr:hypothetical protein [Schinkia azotoformans]MEC1788628.1 hypothetical protein [Schinkia azotoformans]MED4419947.1 hypothetical protein [Schinkia azotoformans]